MFNVHFFEELKKATGNHFQDLFTKYMKRKYKFKYQAIATH